MTTILAFIIVSQFLLIVYLIKIQREERVEMLNRIIADNVRDIIALDSANREKPAAEYHPSPIQKNKSKHMRHNFFPPPDSEE